MAPSATHSSSVICGRRDMSSAPAPRHRVAQDRRVSDDRIVDNPRHLERVGGVPETSGVELKHAPQMGLVVASLLGGFKVLGKDGALGDAGFDDRHTDPEGRQLLGQFLARSLKGPFGGNVGSLGQRGEAARHGRDVDDRAATPMAQPGSTAFRQRNAPYRFTFMIWA